MALILVFLFAWEVGKQDETVHEKIKLDGLFWWVLRSSGPIRGTSLTITITWRDSFESNKDCKNLELEPLKVILKPTREARTQQTYYKSVKSVSCILCNPYGEINPKVRRLRSAPGFQQVVLLVIPLEGYVEDKSDTTVCHCFLVPLFALFCHLLACSVWLHFLFDETGFLEFWYALNNVSPRLEFAGTPGMPMMEDNQAGGIPAEPTWCSFDGILSILECLVLGVPWGTLWLGAIPSWLEHPSRLSDCPTLSESKAWCPDWRHLHDEQTHRKPKFFHAWLRIFSQ